MIKLEGAAELKSTLLGTISAQQAATRQATATAAHLIERTAKEKLATTSHAAGTPTPSAPGEPPSLVTGNLRRSVRVVGPESTMLGGFQGWKAQIGPTAVYGRIQELGGPTLHGMLPARPYLEPSYLEVKPKLRPIFEAAWRKPLML